MRIDLYHHFPSDFRMATSPEVLEIKSKLEKLIMHVSEAFTRIHTDVVAANEGIGRMTALIGDLKSQVADLRSKLESGDAELTQDQSSILNDLDTTVARLEEATPETVKIPTADGIQLATAGAPPPGAIGATGPAPTRASGISGEEEVIGDTVESLQADHTREELVALAEKEGVATSGTKADIAAAIIAKREEGVQH
jgi:hypothetical protein